MKGNMKQSAVWHQRFRFDGKIGKYFSSLVSGKS